MKGFLPTILPFILMKNLFLALVKLHHLF